MENQKVWKKSLGFAPRSNRELSALLDEQCLNKK